MFTALLKETAEMWNVRIAAYCLMPNHYHMLIQTPDANISRSMRHLIRQRKGGQVPRKLVGANQASLSATTQQGGNPVHRGCGAVYTEYTLSDTIAATNAMGSFFGGVTSPSS
jgi:REP element-mobilizing transposase RayT